MPLSPVESYGQTQYVKPVDWTKYAGKTGVQAGDTFGQTLTTVIQNEAVRTELAQYPAGLQHVQGWEGSSCYYPQFSPSYSVIEAVRPLASIAYATAVQIKTGIYSPSVAGVSAATRSTGPNWPSGASPSATSPMSPARTRLLVGNRDGDRR